FRRPTESVHANLERRSVSLHTSDALHNEPVADLHLHSTASDGSDPPAEVVRRAKEAGFTAIALSDHDTMDGVPEALLEAKRIGIECIPAVEYSCLDGKREIHMLGYGFDPDDESLRTQLTRLREGRFLLSPL